ncbi:transcription initiation factor TFIID subunit [Pelomyxa schiedti]|nr:transcription initiation factor TFIID subunit [Pelomyxa schiedti]
MNDGDSGSGRPTGAVGAQQAAPTSTASSSSSGVGGVALPCAPAAPPPTMVSGGALPTMSTSSSSSSSSSVTSLPPPSTQTTTMMMMPSVIPMQQQQQQPQMQMQQQQQQQQQQQSAVGGAQQEAVEDYVLAYLTQKGYKRAEHAMRQEIQLMTVEKAAAAMSVDDDASKAKLISAINDITDSNPHKLMENFNSLKDWATTSLDLYKAELELILFPLFVHCFLDLVMKGCSDEARAFMDQNRDFENLNSSDIHKLQSISTPQQLLENETARLFRENRYIVKMTSLSFELLVNFLHTHKLMQLVAMISQHITIKITSGKPSSTPHEDYQPMTGPDIPDKINSKHRICWGSTYSQTDELTKSKKIPGVEDTPLPKPVSPPKLTVTAEKLLSDDEARKIALSSTALPSICFFSFLYTHSGLNHVGFSSEANLAVGSFSDSSIRIWDFKSPSAASAIASNATESLYGHYGPVYATSFTPDNKWLLSCSEDNTVRLWSLATHTNVVCYKGHQAPVWDVQFSPLGFYFATASHDRTARLWTTNQYAPIRIFVGHLSDVNIVRFHPNVNYVLTGSSDKTIRMWEVSTGTCVRIMAAHTHSVGALAVSPEGRIIASAADDGDIILWDLGTSQRIKTLHSGSNTPVYSLDFSAEGTLLASGGADGAVRLWDVNKALTAASADVPMHYASSTTSATGTQSRTSPELLETFYTKKTPVFQVNFTRRNLLLAAGPFLPKR